MKKVILVFIFMLMPALFFAQSAFDKFDGKDGVTAVIVNKKMFELMSQVKMDDKNTETQQYLSLLKKLNNLKVFTTSNKKVITEMKSTVKTYLKKHPLEELMRINDSGKTIKIYVKSGSKSSQVLELLMFMDGGSDDTVLMTLTGNFDLSEISVLTDKMNLPGGIQLKEASKKS